MNFRDFLTVAATLAAGSTEADWRSSISRAYYAAFHVACDLLRDLHFTVPNSERAHAYLWLRLSNSGHSDVRNAGLPFRVSTSFGRHWNLRAEIMTCLSQAGHGTPAACCVGRRVLWPGSRSELPYAMAPWLDDDERSLQLLLAVQR